MHVIIISSIAVFISGIVNYPKIRGLEL